MSATQGVMLIMLAVLGLFLVWRTDIVDRIVEGARGVRPTP